MAVEYEIVQASPEEPLLVAGAVIDLGRMAEVLLRLDRIERREKGQRSRVSRRLQQPVPV
jgi:hypothetical protein